MRELLQKKDIENQRVGFNFLEIFTNHWIPNYDEICEKSMCTNSILNMLGKYIMENFRRSGLKQQNNPDMRREIDFLQSD